MTRISVVFSICGLTYVAYIQFQEKLTLNRNITHPCFCFDIGLRRLSLKVH